jgi:hypothetical protein
MNSNTGGSSDPMSMLIGALLRATPGMVEKVLRESKADMERMMIGPTRRHLAANGMTAQANPFNFAAASKAYVTRTVGRGPADAHGLVFGMLQIILELDEQIRVAVDTPPEGTDGLTAAAAVSDDLTRKINEAEVEIRRLTVALDQVERVAQRRYERIVTLQGEISRLEQQVLKIDAELVETNGRLQDAEERR